jgi:hypothetical protein
VSLVVVPLTLAGAFLPLPILLDVAHTLMAWLMIPLEWLARFRSRCWKATRRCLDCRRRGGWACAWLLAPRGVPCGRRARVDGADVRGASAVAGTGRSLDRYGSTWVTGSRWSCALRITRSLYDAGPSWSAESDSGTRSSCRSCAAKAFRAWMGSSSRMPTTIIMAARRAWSGPAVLRGFSRRYAPTIPLHEAVEQSIRCEAGFPLDLGWRRVHGAPSRTRDLW